MNKIILIGRLARDPETKYTNSANNIAVTKFCIAADRRFKREGEQEADFINCTAFGKTGEFIQKYFCKGMKIGITGRLQIRNWEDNSGQKRTSAEVVVEEAEFVERKQAANTETPIQAEEEEYSEDDLPF